MKAVANKGFTLIELVVVITIIGILAAVAAPKFIGVQSDARTSVLRGVEASMRSVASLIYAKALIQGQEAAATATVTTNEGPVDTVFGYPALDAIEPLLDIQGTAGSNTPILGDATDGVVGYDRDGNSTLDDNCDATYAASTGTGVAPTVTVDASGC